MGRKNVYIEPRDDGTFAVMKPNAERASAIRDTQREAIDAAKQMFPNVKPDIARVKHTDAGKPDQFRKGDVDPILWIVFGLDFKPPLVLGARS